MRHYLSDHGLSEHIVKDLPPRMYVADLARSWGGAHLESRPWIIGIIKPCNMHYDRNTLQELIDNIELYI